MATGVLIVGVGNGTKSLQGFLDGSKTYDTTMLFGAATDTYDSEGKIVKRAPYEHVTRAMVEEALKGFRGPIMQKPPLFSALRVQGKRLYEYAREGKEVPVEIQERPVTVSELEILEWMEPGTHGFDFPEREAEQVEKDIADKLLPGKKTAEKEEAEAEAGAVNGDDKEQDLKRKREEEGENAVSADEISLPKRAKQDSEIAAAEDAQPAPIAPATRTEQAAPTTTTTTSAPAPTETSPTTAQKPPCQAPAARIRMTVSSGFYVRSLCHDLGAAVDSLGFMVALARTRQSEFEVGKNVLEYDDLALGEEIWGPKIVGMLEAWNERHPDGYERVSQPAKRQHGSASSAAQKGKSERQRNSSSPEA